MNKRRTEAEGGRDRKISWTERQTNWEIVSNHQRVNKRRVGGGGGGGGEGEVAKTD